MGNRLFQEARKAVAQAKQAKSGEIDMSVERAVAIAKNALSSVYAHSNTAEKAQLRQFQAELDELTQ
ncbi:DUF3813 domain-containing protein [Geobacillus stearothermophilus]|uniref:DUF3813 domain-containing protein n=1 Tax=Geobacillus stearothermophilus TaxID=1422 RepID=UPI0006AC8555|nr:DUF3813 domain-containing protein [Geobacillus stearothermophilus]KOR94438.1 hypothetical protein N231_07145 [Geobacillus stearothermophilus ATCC 12980]MED4358811.1 DUF3813 domain-containing protein [Geobacillus stearothermophilus]MED4881097.1 DUF3813 domain-containing protein [Geobacillus stearothermophilus]MED5011362.1 DUF3813 domain-containing protein [Geobacillus stearothermophilus]MED5014472.1 DUF3813 domain-containing protein [Geobacillus stearothermophilus]